MTASNSNPYMDVEGQNPYMELGDIPKTENFLQKAIKTAGTNIQQGAENLSTEFGPNMAAGGPSLAAMSIGAPGKNVEDSLPFTSQIMGNIAGGEAGLMTAGAPVRGGAIGGTIGRTVGETARQGIKSVFRNQQPSGKEIGIQALIGAGTEAAGMPFAWGTNKLFSGPAGAEFRGKVGEALGHVKDLLNHSGQTIPGDDVVMPIWQRADEIRQNMQSHPQLADFIEKTGDDLADVAAKKGGNLEPIDLSAAQKRMDDALEQLGVYGKKTVKKSYDEIGGTVGATREQLSGQTQQLADQAGLGKQLSKKKEIFSKVASDYPRSSSKHGILKAILEGTGIHQLIGGNPLGAIGNIAASEAVGSAPVWKAGYTALKAGKAAPSLVSEGINFFRNKK